MDETAYLTDCSTFSHTSVSTLDERNGFCPRLILFLLRKKDDNLIAKAKPLQEHFKCPSMVVVRENFCDADVQNIPQIIQEQTLVVIDDFEGPLFEYLQARVHSAPATIQVRGPPAFIDACDKLSVEGYKRPLFCNAMATMVFFLPGFQGSCKRLKKKIANQIRFMGGSVANHAGNRITHIVTDSSLTEGYEYGRTFQLPVLSMRWVSHCWERRYEIGFKAGDLRVVDYTLKIFCNLFVCFVGFERNEVIHIQRLNENDGTLVDLTDPRLTHIVVNDCERNVTFNFNGVKPCVFIVRSAWFWTSIKEETKAPEASFVFNNQPHIVQKSYSQNCCAPSAPSLDQSSSLPSVHEENGSLNNNNESCSRNLLSNAPSNKKTHTLLELVQTEENYVNALNTIMRIQEYTVDSSQAGGALLSEGEARIIFGNVAAIHRIHLTILHDLIRCAENWNDEETLIGPIFADRAQEILDCYSPFIKYYDVSNNILTDCEKKNPRFHAYLQLCKNNECGKQNMKDLLIRPVQRLASTSLLLKDLIKTTHPNHPDHSKLNEALRNIEDVMSTINNDRKDISDRSAIFDVFNLIENCPPVLISAGRTFIFQFEAQEISEASTTLSRRGDYLVFYIFTDCLEICRKKKKVAATTKEGALISDKLMKLMHGKPYKHVVLMEFSTLRSIDNIVNDGDGGDGDFFGLTCRDDGELVEKHYFFRFIKYMNTNCNKIAALTVLKKIMEQTEATLTFQPKIITKSAKEVGLNVSNLSSGLKPLTNFAYRTRVFMEGVFKNVDTSSSVVTQQYKGLPNSCFTKSLSLDNLLTETQDNQEETNALRTASFPIGKR